ncbi:MAG: phosphatidylglycerophosphatase A [Candidatus Sabulitectum sp.]|nr:phosphatidylglycerophosphatase A [Candidatus Sabulitectum sp.]
MTYISRLWQHRVIRFLGGALASTMGTGFFPWGPGTVGSIIAAVAFYYYPLNPFTLLPAVLLLSWLGCEAGRKLWGEDPSIVTIDEVAGTWIACLAAPHGWGIWGILAALVLFRIFDIAKPWPVNKLDEMKNGIGILLDDVAAGLMAAGVLLIAYLIDSLNVF